MDDELFSLVLQATLQRSKIYSKTALEEDKSIFKNGLRSKLDNLRETYTQQITDLQHFANIEKLADEISNEHRVCLNNGRFRIGCAQKSLNLYLKYLWCLAKIPNPPHCPFDRIIISRLISKSPPNWTEMDNIEMYKELVDLARLAANGKSIAEWELIEYNK
ncbi:MAG: hypothetical protein WBR15_03810 [Gammaproteobacteria bacterium]